MEERNHKISRYKNNLVNIIKIHFVNKPLNRSNVLKEIIIFNRKSTVQCDLKN